MATYIDIDTGKRPDKIRTQPSEFILNESQTSSWFRPPRMTRNHPTNLSFSNSDGYGGYRLNPNHSIQEFVTVAGVSSFITPYEISAGNFLSDEVPILYVDIHSRSQRDVHLVSGIDSTNPDAKFVLYRDAVLTDDAGTKKWIRWKSKMKQAMRFKRDGVFEFRVFDKDGNTINIDDRELAVFAGTPTVRVKTIGVLPSATYGVNTITGTTGSNVLVIDGVTTAINDYILVNDETNPINNGIYQRTADAGADWQLTRAVGFQVGDTPARGTYVDVTEGTIYADQRWVLFDDFVAPTNVVGTDPVSFTVDTDHFFEDRQIHAVFEMTPYVNSDDYSNQLQGMKIF